MKPDVYPDSFFPRDQAMTFDEAAKNTSPRIAAVALGEALVRDYGADDASRLADMIVASVQRAARQPQETSHD